MLHVLTHVGPSPIAGVGLFVDEPVLQGALIYSDDAFFVQVITETQIAELPPSAQAMLKRYGYRGRRSHVLPDGVYYCCDDGRFMNHSETPNLAYRESDSCWIAAQDLAVGNELTCDYRIFEDPRDWEPFLHTP